MVQHTVQISLKYRQAERALKLNVYDNSFSGRNAITNLTYCTYISTIMRVVFFLFMVVVTEN